jgi:hypothetical protein
MKETERGPDFTIDNMQSLSIKNNWCSWCVNVFVSDASGEWSSCGTGLLSFYGRRRGSSSLSRIASAKELKAEAAREGGGGWEPHTYRLEVKAKKNLANNNRAVQVDPELKRKLAMGAGEDTILSCDLKKAAECALTELVITWFQEDIGEYLAMSFLSAVTIIESW